MSKIIYLRKQPGGILSPEDEEAEEVLRTYKTGSLIRNELTKVRNAGFHRKFFALVNHLYSRQSLWESRDDFLDVLKIGAGHSTLLILPDGSKQPKPKSISFGKCDQHQFEEFVNKVITFCVKDVGVLFPGLTEDECWSVVNEVISFA